MPPLRNPSVPLSVKQIHEATYRQVDGWDPDYLIIEGRRVYRTLLIGMIIQRTEHEDRVEYIFDDGSGSIPVLFTDQKPLVKEGEVVLLIGRPRDLTGRIIIGEILRPVDAAWRTYWERKRAYAITWQPRAEDSTVDVEALTLPEEQTLLKEADKEDMEPNVEEEGDRHKKSDTERVYELIRKLDDGLGAPVERVLEEAMKEGIHQAEKAIRFMLEVGDIFEIRAGRLKVL